MTTKSFLLVEFLFSFIFLSSLVFPCFFFLFPLIFNCAVALGVEVLPHDTRLIPMEEIGIDAVHPFSFFGVSDDQLS